MDKPPEILLGFDFGTKRIGVAIGQTVTKTARPLGMLPANQGVPRWEAVAKLIQDWKPDALVIGVPLNMDGTEQPLTQAARQFANALTDKFKLPVYGMDERLTSVEAKARTFDAGGYKALKNTQIDSVAAQLILQNWLELSAHTVISRLDHGNQEEE
jgi:putative Holliday junction resolvase